MIIPLLPDTTRFIVEARDLITDSYRPCAALRRYAAERGHYSREGGWLYRKDGEPITQGWFNYASMMIRGGKMRESVEIREVARATRVRRFRAAAERRRKLSADVARTRPLSMDVGIYAREAVAYDEAADIVEAMVL